MFTKEDFLYNIHLPENSEYFKILDTVFEDICKCIVSLDENMLLNIGVPSVLIFINSEDHAKILLHPSVRSDGKINNLFDTIAINSPSYKMTTLGVNKTTFNFITLSHYKGKPSIRMADCFNI